MSRSVPAPIEGVLDTDVGYDFGAVVGYDFGGFRLEAETSYREADISETSSSTALLPAGAGTALSAGNAYATAGDANALSFMVNGLLDFGDDDGLQGFVGAGIGVARIDVHNIFAAPAWLDDSDTGFRLAGTCWDPRSAQRQLGRRSEVSLLQGRWCRSC
jgi:OOP family OmpA-OmpF porin